MSKRIYIMGLIALVLSVPGCRVVDMQAAALQRDYRAAGMTPQRMHRGPDHMYYWHGGAKQARETVVLVHGFGGACIVQWAEQVEALHENYELVVPDLLWFGDSLSTQPDYSLEHQVRAVSALLDDLGVGKAHFVGVSYGGLVSYQLASTHPDRARSITIIDSPGRAYLRTDYDALLQRFDVKHPKEIFVPRRPEDLDRIFGLAYHDPPFIPGFALDQIYERYYVRFQSEQARLLDELFLGLDRLTKGPEYSGRALIVWGRHDPVFPLAIGRRLHQRLPGSQFVLIEEAAHAPNVERSDEVNQALLSFLAHGSDGGAP